MRTLSGRAPLSSVVIIGGGGHAKVVALALLSQRESILGIVDPRLDVNSAGPLGLKVLGDDEALMALNPELVRVANGVGTRRREIYERFVARGFTFPVVQHASAVVAPTALVADGVQLLTAAVVHPDASIGRDTVVNTQAVVEHDCIVGRHVLIAPRALLCGGVRVGDNCFIGAGSVIVESVTLGSGCFIAAGAVVTHDLPDGQRVAGVPAKPYHPR